MLKALGQRFTDFFIRFMPSAYVFALLLTLLSVVAAFVLTNTGPLDILTGWYEGFWKLLSFGMQIVLVIVTAYSIAQSGPVQRFISSIARFIDKPTQVYLVVIIVGCLMSLISFGMVVVTAILARELALKVKGVHYPFLVGCVYFTMNTWVSGFSSSIALLLNTENNFLIKDEILSGVIGSSMTLGSSLNLAMILVFLVIAPLLFSLLIPKDAKGAELTDLLVDEEPTESLSVKEEAKNYKLPFKALSDILNNSWGLQLAVASLGLIYIIYHFYTRGFDLDFNIIIFIFIIIGLFLHQTPMRYSISMKRSSRNISGILFQYPFYAGIMGIMAVSGLGEQLGQWLASVATEHSYPFFAYLAGGVVNFAIPSAGGEFAVIGPSIIEVVKEIGADLPSDQLNAMIARASMSVAYGESLSNLLQPFFLLIVFPVMGAGIRIQARDVVGYLFIPFIIFFILQSLLVLYMPL